MQETPKVPILLIEDSATQAMLYREMITSASSDFTVATADRLSTGLEALAKGNVELVLLDLTLPDAQGLVTFFSVHSKFPNTPIILLTGLNDGRIGNQAMKAGAMDYLVKAQCNPNLLLRSMRYALERKRANVLSEQRKRDDARLQLAAAAESSRDAVIIMDKHGIVRGCNLSAEEMTGYLYAELVGQPVTKLVSAEGAVDFGRVLDEVIESVYIERKRVKFVRKEGTTFDANATVSPTYDQFRKVNGVSMLVKDVSQQVRLEQQYQAQVQELFEAINKAVSGNTTKCLALQNQIVEGLSADAGADKAVAKEVIDVLQQSSQEILNKLAQLKDACQAFSEASTSDVRTVANQPVEKPSIPIEPTQETPGAFEGGAPQQTATGF